MTDKPQSNLADWTIDMIDNLIANYDRLGKVVGGRFTKAELLAEKHRRLPSDFDIPQLAKWIVKSAQVNQDGKVTYLDIWKEFRPGEPWIGHGSLGVVSNALGRVIGYSIRHQLPTLSVLVVEGSKRRLTEQAEENIHEFARRLGAEVGLDAHAYAESQSRAALAVNADTLPSYE
jgi:hypothetical protein